MTQKTPTTRTRITAILYLIAAALFLAVVLCGCSILNQTPTPTLPVLTIQDVIVHRPLSANALTHDWGLPVYDPSQIGLGLVRPEDANTNPDELPQNDELSLAEGEYLSLYLVLRSAEQATFLVTALVDYHQTPFTMDGQIGLLHEVDVGLGGDLYVPMQIEINGPGAHDLTFIAFKNPYNRPMDHDYDRSDSMLIGYRTVVIIGNDNRPVAVAQPDAIGNPPPAGVDWGPDILFAKPGNVHPSHPKGQIAYVEAQGKPNQVFNYRIWLSNLSWTEPEPVTYGLVRFLNYHQIEFKGKDLFVVYLDKNQEILLDDSLTLPAQAGVNEVQIVYVRDPYKSLLHNEVSVRIVYGSPCLGIKVP